MKNEERQSNKRRSWRFGAVLAFFILGYVINGDTMHDSMYATPPKDNSEEKFVSWVKANAIPLDTLDWRKVTAKDLGFLDRALQGKRVVYLGEPDHYIHEKYDYRLILIQYLFERGWRHIGNEMGLSDGKRIDQFIATGDPTWLERVAIYGYRGG